ncbi:branched-chain amino acid aminotransferase [Saccharomonospora sp. CUA-673]|uniref:aminotransferase class IV n=1 Tax=Saccharomonospora sp. CUA-673 TaxID=1904969 RepID=UPI00096026D2|nr:aminotransferase class IV [Saccharomonospora sp. CUA-673]OLT48752.1 branched-chain amino acid aminotransferase [Saccharomonospora sp. CUA-673]
MTTAPAYAWQNGKLIPWDECVVHARSQGAFWGANVFEGIRAYVSPDDGVTYAFRVQDHLDRLRRSMKSLHMEIDHSDAELTDACTELVRANAFGVDVHVCIVAYFDLAPDFDSLGYTPETGVHITSTVVPRSPAYRDGVAATVSSWRRISDDAMPPRIKTGANYHNSRLAQHEAMRNGFATTLLLNQRGTVSEAPGSCVVMVRAGELVTPPGTSGVLEGITVNTTATLAERFLDMPMRHREIDRTELHAADELFLCGTKSELLPITSVDRIPIGTGSIGPVTRELQDRYDDAVLGRLDQPGWCTPVPMTRTEVPA